MLNDLKRLWVVYRSMRALGLPKREAFGAAWFNVVTWRKAKARAAARRAR
jgi:hypothetical protein